MTAWDVVLVIGYHYKARPAQPDWQLSHALAASAERRVLYVAPPTFIQGAVRDRRLGSFRPHVEEAAANLTVLKPVATPGSNRPSAAWLGDLVVGRQIRAASRHMEGRRLVITFDPRRGALAMVKRDALVYWRVDRVAESATARRAEHIARRERRLMKQATLVTGVSQPLVDEAVAAGARRAVLIPNACNYEHFRDRRPLPDELRNLPRPVIGFAGGVSHRVDIDLLIGLADARPDWSFAVVGEIVTHVPPRPNLIVTGSVAYEELPAWLQGFDVGIVPYRRDRFNLASSPLKVFEYLAAGRPVVSTSLPAVTSLAPFVRVADDLNEFENAIEAALRDGPQPEACAEAARGNTWNDRARLLEVSVEEVLSAE